MLTFEEFVWIVRSWYRNKDKTAARCIECNTLDWWPRTTPSEKRVCFSCYYYSEKI